MPTTIVLSEENFTFMDEVIHKKLFDSYSLVIHAALFFSNHLNMPRVDVEYEGSKRNYSTQIENIYGVKNFSEYVRSCLSGLETVIAKNYINNKTKVLTVFEMDMSNLGLLNEAVKNTGATQQELIVYSLFNYFYLDENIKLDVIKSKGFNTKVWLPGILDELAETETGNWGDSSKSDIINSTLSYLLRAVIKNRRS